MLLFLPAGPPRQVADVAPLANPHHSISLRHPVSSFRALLLTAATMQEANLTFAYLSFNMFQLSRTA